MLIRVPLSWLREYVDVTISVDDLAHRLHMSGTEVKGIERQKWDKIWVGRVAELSKHPNADKLQLATVDYGEGRREDRRDRRDQPQAGLDRRRTARSARSTSTGTPVSAWS